MLTSLMAAVMYTAMLLVTVLQKEEGTVGADVLCYTCFCFAHVVGTLL